MIRCDSKARTLDEFITIVPLSNKKVRTEDVDNENFGEETLKIDTEYEESPKSTMSNTKKELQKNDGASSTPNNFRLYDSITKPIEAKFIESFTPCKDSRDLDSKDNDNGSFEMESSASTICKKSYLCKKWNEVKLTSVINLKLKFKCDEKNELTEIFKEHVFVGCFNNHLALIQHQTNLYLVNYSEISQEFIYQVVLQGFSNFGSINFQNPLSIYDSVMLVLETF